MNGHFAIINRGKNPRTSNGMENCGKVGTVGESQVEESFDYLHTDYVVAVLDLSPQDLLYGIDMPLHDFELASEKFALPSEKFCQPIANQLNHRVPKPSPRPLRPNTYVYMLAGAPSHAPEVISAQASPAPTPSISACAKPANFP